MTLTLDAMAEAFEAAAAVFRRHAALATAEPSDLTLDAVSRARALHPALGKRQMELIGLLEAAGTSGTNTGELFRSMNYSQPNVYLTLAGLRNLGFVEKDEKTAPHTYRLTHVLLH